MGTKQQTTGSNTSNLQFNPMAQSAYNQLVGGGSKVLQGYINNPFGNSMYTLGAQASQRGAQQQGANNMAALNQNQLAQGMSGNAGAGWLAAQKAQTGRANASMSSQANIANVMSALQRQMQATGMGMSFSPQLTGQTGNFQQTQQTSGLGTWLPQLAGGLMSGAMGMMTGGASSILHPGAGASSAPMSSAFPGFGMTGSIPGVMGMGQSQGMPMMPTMNPTFPSMGSSAMYGG